MRISTAVFMSVLCSSAVAVAQNMVPSKTEVPGDSKSGKTRALEAGAKVMQRNVPLQPFDVYLVGFHPMKERPELQMESHHYCHQLTSSPP